MNTCTEYGIGDLWEFNRTHWKVLYYSEVSVLAPCAANSDKRAPGRSAAGHWTGTDSALYVFGGKGYNAKETCGYGMSNELWKDFTTFVGGSTALDAKGVYSPRGVLNALTWPGAREQCASWSNAGGDGLIFGGYGFDASDEGFLGGFNLRCFLLQWSNVCEECLELICISGLHPHRGCVAIRWDILHIRGRLECRECQ